jgi:hypothetical protein
MSYNSNNYNFVYGSDCMNEKVINENNGQEACNTINDFPGIKLMYDGVDKTDCSDNNVRIKCAKRKYLLSDNCMNKKTINENNGQDACNKLGNYMYDGQDDADCPKDDARIRCLENIHQGLPWWAILLIIIAIIIILILVFGLIFGVTVYGKKNMYVPRNSNGMIF